MKGFFLKQQQVRRQLAQPCEIKEAIDTNLDKSCQ
jgi:hypothetical protein